MIVSCPACDSRFQVDREQLGYDGRTVRCGKCGNCWHQMPEKDPRELVMEAREAESASRRRAAPPPRKRSWGVAIGWGLLLLLVAGVVAGGWFGREQVIAQFPQFGDLYALIGVPVTKPGPVFQLSDVNVASSVVEGDTVITVHGVVTNLTKHKQRAPKLRARLTDSAGKALAEWTFDLPQNDLDAGAKVDFETETKNPPNGALNVSITFAEAAH